ncbi:MAG: amidohydrolase [Pseudomonadales bacterium]|nr:amidohydrolase [Pseudomonadales bacterium]MBO6565415.1 amidohydrolase [Pseudomonadales bacterium]MBO6595319.1 amidohydrolase [Pseudomonadales bacterium]MBO6655793.1 amidohydrolase [Pseudomonadales bacterium]MBO6701820.1 amidohydrolase [Pseudomonadales bacterium]
MLHLIQTALKWEDPAANGTHFESYLDNLSDGVAVLPEMFSTGFSMDSETLAESMYGPTHTWMLKNAKQRNLTLCGSIIIHEHGRYLNRFLWVTPDEETRVYDKRHLFRMAGEHEHYSGGESNLTVLDAATRIRPQICYDLRFPVWSRNTDDAYDLLLFIANWPAARREQWLALLKARAIENLSYVVGLNRIGDDGNGVQYSGDSVVFGPEGETIVDLGNEDTVATFEPDLDRLRDYRERFPAHLDADHFSVT